jgi:ribose transport system ATP-binding protein
MSKLPLLRMVGISKRFGATQALNDVSLDVFGGEVLALIGENGAGKSTLMKVLSGAHPPDSGQMEFDGAPYQPAGPHAARLIGVAMIYQELNLAPDLTVEDNIMLGREEHRFGFLRRHEQRRRVREALDLLGHPDLHPKIRVGKLSVGARQVVEIARALVHQAQVLVFDEPTSSLPQRDVERLFNVIARLKRSGHGIVYISHFLEEVRRIADRYAVLRDGKNAGQGPLSEVTDSTIVSLMVGRAVDELFPQVPHTPGDPILRLQDLSGRNLPTRITFELRRGEILGISGLVGAGRTETLRCLFGLDRVTAGSVYVCGKELSPHPKNCIRAGLGLLSEDRKQEGLAQGLSITDNTTLSHLSPFSFAGWLSVRLRRRAAANWMTRLDIKARHPEQEVSTLSGGNQQKVALARILHQDAEIFLLDEPTRGIDVGTKAAIYQLMGELAAKGKAIIFVSSYLPELMAVCDRIAVMNRGELRDIRPTDQWTEEAILACAIAGTPSVSSRPGYET